MSDQDFSEWRELEVTVKQTYRFRTLRCSSYEVDVRAAELESAAHDAIIASAEAMPTLTEIKGRGFKVEWLRTEYRNMEKASTTLNNEKDS